MSGQISKKVVEKCLTDQIWIQKCPQKVLDIFRGNASMVLDGGKIVLDGGNMVLDGGKIVLDGGNMVLDGGNMVLDGGNMVLDGGNMVLDGGKKLKNKYNVMCIICKLACVGQFSPTNIIWNVIC
jgi:hypothetical protein